VNPAHDEIIGLVDPVDSPPDPHDAVDQRNHLLDRPFRFPPHGRGLRPLLTWDKGIACLMGSDFFSDATHQPTRQWQQAETEGLIIRHRFDPNAVLEVAGGRRWASPGPDIPPLTRNHASTARSHGLKTF
jgi:hypothetical protein